MLNDLNDTYELALRYVASCRLSYYPSVASIPRHKHIGLSPPSETPTRQWPEIYKASLVAHILESSGLPDHSRYVPICRNLPILAVFVSYLYQTGREPQLAELLREADFSAWIARRVQLSFGDASIARQLALVMMLSPLTDTTFTALAGKGQGLLLDRLATDGWIERFSEDGRSGEAAWYTAHDILADRMIASYLSWVPETVGRFVEEGIEIAYDVDALRSALTSLQRLVDQPTLRTCDWHHLIFSATKFRTPDIPPSKLGRFNHLA
ncbi:MAG: hypothetical protein NT090_03120 [Acidobacteria bacterium]|nr:hypothetical protein [Acidobacteriota bacterium]